MVHLLVVQTGIGTSIECSTDFCNSPLLLLPIFSMLQTAAVISCLVSVESFMYLLLCLILIILLCKEP